MHLFARERRSGIFCFGSQLDLFIASNHFGEEASGSSERIVYRLYILCIYQVT